MNAHENRHPELDDPRVIEALDKYLAALETGHKPDRASFLAQHPEIAETLAECLEGMEALHEASSASQPPAAKWTAPADWQPGAPLGDYRILREIGRGGMGVVYEAEQLSLGRRIALKVLPFALTLDPRQLQRFKNEARAAAQLHHPNIVPVYAVGSERGEHFYAMQFIEGQSLAEVIQGLRQLAQPDKASSTPPPASNRAITTGPYPARMAGSAPETAERSPNSLATAYSTNSAGFYRTVARLGIQAAQALEHAHQYGVVHRDIKPGNLLVDAHNRLWVTDFGLAQFQSEVGLTQSSDLLGTLRYMSPEQAGGQRVLLDHRTDIYSLGATLYELLTLRPPFDGADRQRLLHQILNDEPRPLRDFQKAIPVELETIVLKAMSKTPTERYATAQDLADDLTRFLEHQPIRARRATAAQRLRKWGRRHPSIVWAAGVLCLLTVAGSLVSAAMIQSAYEREKQRAQEAKQEYQLAKEAVDSMFKLCKEELADKPFLEGLRRRLLEDALVYYQKLIEQRREDQAAQEELTAARKRVQQILGELAELQGAGQLNLLKEEAVLDDLDLNQEQREQLGGLTRKMDERWGASFRDFRRLTSENRHQQFLRVARQNEKDVEEILTKSERRRLRQIDLQIKGGRAFEEADVIAGLKLMPMQREAIRKLEAESFLAGPMCHPGPDGPPKGLPPGSSVVERIKRVVLSAEQNQLWEQLTGKPFTGRLQFRGPPPHPPDGKGGSPHRSDGKGRPPRK
jgi:eukaryotic-like serine/threonine-protein kinase